MKVSDALSSRKSVRQFLDRPVDLDLLADLLVKASGSPSGGNLQPWHIHIVAGEAMGRLKAMMAERVAAEPCGEGTEYDIYPRQMGPEYKRRTFETAELLYGRLGIPREDKAARGRWFANNFQFFGAPIGLFCFVDRDHGPPQWSDLGMYLQSLMLLLREAGLDSCPQECWALYHRTVQQFVGAPPELMLFTGMAIGWADTEAGVNDLKMPRVPLDTFARFHIEAAD